MRPTPRRIRILAGLATVTFMVGTSTMAVLFAAGTFSDVYEIQASFDTAGQGLIKRSDVKIRGVNVGEVKRVELAGARALVTMRIKASERIPADATAVVRPKTLFGEKFVDIVVTPGSEQRGPYLHGGDRIAHTVGSFELERVLSEAAPLLQAVDPAELRVILDTLARASAGEGPRIDEQIRNWSQVAGVFARHDADTRQFLDDFDRLAGVLDARAGDVNALDRSLNRTLPVLNADGDKLATFLQGATDLSRALADVLERSRPALETLVTRGGRALTVLDDNRDRIGPLVRGLRDFAKVLAQATMYDGAWYQWKSDGRMATVKFVGDTQGLLALACSLSPSLPACAVPLGSASTGNPAPRAIPTAPVPPVTRGVEAVIDMLGHAVLPAPGQLTGAPVPAGARG